MKTVILGAGSLGCVFGGFLTKAGYDITLIGRRKRHTDAIRNGLTITGVKGTYVAKVKATHDSREVKTADVLILLTKTVDSITALDSVSHLYQVVKCAVSLQNGMLKDEHLKERFGKEKVIGGTTMTGGALLGDGKVEFTTDGITSFGEFDGKKTERVQSIVDMFNKAGMMAQAVDDIRSVEWTKLLLATPGLGTSALTRLPIHKIQKNRMLAGLYVRLVKEAWEVAKRDGAKMGNYPALEMIRRVVDSDFEHAVGVVVENGLKCEAAGQINIITSMYQSITAGRKTEVDETIGYVARRAEEMGVNAPIVEFCYTVIKGIDAYLR